jgi:5-methylthioadenosine/S-adenosylhomocysteine deaminase
MSSAAIGYRARWVLPVSSDPIADGVVYVRDGVIIEVVPFASASMSRDAHVVDLGNSILLPGLINVHSHPELSILRGALEDLPFHQWIPRLRRNRAGIRFTADDWRDAARWSCAEAAAGGVTTLGATEDSDAALHALRDAGMRGVAYREVFAPAAADATAALDRLRAQVDEMRALETDLVHVGVSPHAPYSVCDVLFTGVAEFAAKHGLPIAVHASESLAETELVTRGVGAFADALNKRGIETPVRGASTIAMLDRTGILQHAPLLIHCVRVDRTDMQRIAATGSSVAHCPAANARLGHGIAPVAEMLDEGVVVGLGSDSVASNNRIDMLEEARIAQMMQRARLQSATALSSPQLLRLATIDGARALRIDDRVGTLDVGKDADMCAVTIGTPHTRPSFDPVSTLFMSAHAGDVSMTMVRGHVIYRDGRHTTLDVRALADRMDTFGAAVRAAAVDESIVI